VIAAAGVLAAAIAGCGSGSRPPRPGRTTRRITARTQTSTTTKVTPAAVPPALAELERNLRRQLASAGIGSGAYVYDLPSGRTLFSLRADVMRPPASVEKLYTSVAVLTEFGPGVRLHTQVLGTGRLGRGGVWHGDLYLRGGGDPTLGDGTFNSIWEDGYGPTAEQLVNQLGSLGIRRVAGLVIGDASLFDSLRGGPATGYAADVPDIGGQLAALTYDHGAATGRLSPGAFATKELVLTMRRSGIRARAARSTATTPPDAQPLAEVSSPPVSVLLKLTDVPSDDFFAEMLTKQLGVRFGTGGSTTAGADVISSAVATFGLHPTIVDGSGLSRSDRSSPHQVVDLLRSVWSTPTGRELQASLPVVGVTGTVAHIGLHTAAQGRCEAKTGTLNYVTNLAGYCHSRDGDELAFALFIDGPGNSQAALLLGRMVAAIARY
jgi:D-alanyl-D-alanine carboxypeptidase/D-alanyl-D-alanine-endopeptidase (penicillin-binding protein 4)